MICLRKLWCYSHYQRQGLTSAYRNTCIISGDELPMILMYWGTVVATVRHVYSSMPTAKLTVMYFTYIIWWRDFMKFRCWVTIIFFIFMLLICRDYRLIWVESQSKYPTLVLHASHSDILPHIQAELTLMRRDRAKVKCHHSYNT